MFATLAYFFKPTLRVIGALLVAEALAMLFPTAIAFFLNEETLLSFAAGTGITLAAGLILMFTMRKAKRDLEARDAFLLVTLTWLFSVLFASLPLAFSLQNLSYPKIFFETMSCLTTTGATVLSGLNDMPLSVNWWRCMLSWLGGMGILVLAVAILPFLGVGGAQAFRAENTMLFKESKLTPRIADTAKALYSLYLALSAACVIAYYWAGMDWKDAFMFMFTTVSLGGGAPYDESIGYFNSAAVLLVSAVFMALAGFNFILHFTAWRQKSILVYFRDPEAAGWVFSLAAGTAIVFAILMTNGVYEHWGVAFEYAVFNVVSLFSTTGYTTVDYSLWPCGAGFFLLFGGMISTSSGSTGGGVKMSRFIIALKAAALSLTKLNRPRACLTLRFGRMEVETEMVENIFMFFVLHTLVVITATLTLLAAGTDFITAISSVLSCVSNIGPALGGAGPFQNYGHFSNLYLTVCSLCMFLGRLEIIAVFAIFTRSFWRI